MTVLENLSDEESYLWAILSDPSGLDQAEFLWFAEDHDHGCFRAWSFQHSWWRSEEPLQIDQAARSVGKSLSIQVKGCAFPLLYPAQEMVITAPEGIHLQAVTDLIETRLLNTRLYRAMLLTNANRGITHRPLLVKFQNEARIMGRIPQRDGRGVKGVHPIHLELDEAQDYPSPGWTEIIETLKRGTKGARWRVHGVTRGVRDEFYKFTQEGSGWQVHRITAMSRPTWTDEERQEKIGAYGSVNHPDYRRNVLGLHGDVQNPLFVLTRLMKCWDLDAASDYNENVYRRLNINAEMVDDVEGDIFNLIDLPLSHAKNSVTWAGMDVGYTNHPSEILVFSEGREKKSDNSTTMTLLSRFHLERIANPDQVKLILWLMEFYDLNGFSLDKTGVGLPLFQDIQAAADSDPRLKSRLDRFKGYNFSEKIIVDFDDSIDVEEFGGDVVDDSGIKRRVLEYASDKLREYVDLRRLRMPNDRDLLAEFQGQTWTYDKSTMDMYGRKKYSAGSFHALDAARMAILGQTQDEMEAFLRDRRREEPRKPVLDMFIPS